jgi:hypothetical protein
MGDSETPARVRARRAGVSSDNGGIVALELGTDVILNGWGWGRCDCGT